MTARCRRALACGFLLAALPLGVCGQETTPDRVPNPAAAPGGTPGKPLHAEAPPTTIGVLFSRDLPPYREAVEGFKARLGPDGAYTFVELIVTESEVGQLMDRVKAAQPALILTLGTEASKVAAVRAADTPIVFAMVANPVDSGVLPQRAYPGQMVAGVTTDVSPAEQFRTLRQAVPDARRVAVIYCPQYTEATVTAADASAKTMGMELIRFPVEPYRVDLAIDRLENAKVDALWTLTDPGVMVSAAAKRILTSALKAKTPVVGFSPAMVQAGALLGLGIDAKAIGRQAGNIAVAILGGEKRPADFHLVYPDETSVHVNLTVAARIGLALPKEFVAKAKTVHGQ